METLFDSDWLNRDRKKLDNPIEHWAGQLYDVLEGLCWLHDQGFVAGSIAPGNILFKANKEPWGLIHLPGLSKVNDNSGVPLFAQWPYYSNIKKFVTFSDDVVAAAIVIVEGLYSDLNLRRDWNNMVNNRYRYENDPKSFLKRALMYFEDASTPYDDLIETLNQVGRGEVQTMFELSQPFLRTARAFRQGIKEKNWPICSLFNCQRQLAACAIDFLAASTFPHN